VPPVDTNSPPMNPFYYAFGLAPIVDLVAGIWNFNKYSELDGTEGSIFVTTWISLYKTELFFGIFGLIEWGVIIGFYNKEVSSTMILL